MLNKNTGTLVCIHFCNDELDSISESIYLESDEVITQEDIIERFAYISQEYEESCESEIAWAIFIVIPLQDPKSTWRMEYKAKDGKGVEVLQ